jgi:hypothetical protein
MPVFLRVMKGAYIFNVNTIQYVSVQSPDEWTVFFSGIEFITLDLAEDIDALEEIMFSDKL